MILDIDKKIEQTTASLEDKYTVQDVFNKFIELFPQDVEKA